jgi:hypothetical protein
LNYLEQIKSTIKVLRSTYPLQDKENLSIKLIKKIKLYKNNIKKILNTKRKEKFQQFIENINNNMLFSYTKNNSIIKRKKIISLLINKKQNSNIMSYYQQLLIISINNLILNLLVITPGPKAH